MNGGFGGSTEFFMCLLVVDCSSRALESVPDTGNIVT